MLRHQRVFGRLKELSAAGAVLALLLVPMSASGQTWTWTSEIIDTDGKVSALAADAQGNLHISYQIEANWKLKYGFRPAGSSRWFTMVLREQLGSFFTQIALDSQGNPHICFTPGSIQYAHFDGRKWHFQEIASGVGYTCSVTVAPDGTPHLAWYHLNENGEAFYHLKHAVLEDGAWLTRTLDFDGEAGKYNSMRLDARGFPHISYSRFANGELRYVHWDGKTWVRKTLDSPEFNLAGDQRGMGNSIVLDPQGRAEISYYDNIALKYARERGTKWSIEIVDPDVDRNFTQVGWAGYRSSQVLDKQGYPHICYESAAGLKHAYWDGKQWKVQLIVSAPTTKVFFYSSTAIDGNDVIYLSYHDPFDGALKLAIGRPSVAANTGKTEKAENKTDKN